MFKCVGLKCFVKLPVSLEGLMIDVPGPSQKCCKVVVFFGLLSSMAEPEFKALRTILHLIFNLCYQASVETSDFQHFRLTSLGWDGEYEAGTRIQLHLMPHFTSRPFLIQADIDGQDICGFPTTAKPTTTSLPPTTTTTIPTTTTTTQPTTTTPEPNECDEVLYIEETEGPETIVEVHLIPTVNIYEWVVELRFKGPIRDIITSSAVVTGAGTGWRLVNKPGEGSIEPGQKVAVKLVVLHTEPWMPRVEGVSFNGRTVCGDMPSVQLNEGGRNS